jgi:hypothetical protein
MSEAALPKLVYRSRYRDNAMGWTNRGLNPSKDNEFFTSSEPPLRLWAHTVSISLGITNLSQEESGGGVNMTNHL